ncbi:hypothetical protein DYD21_20075 [Rhodohalobacter sp. SW132]|uniref:HEAT repeat domain-containing protein n=1 Tax=Rhodohalobacter sp. SW132 TaxID=2293433 RepID=UPI000E26F808|nr:HEAT repeat domain-containing protein [Rhodohalobacter sp. SW132]REL24109.1 hypothetical protein DYD21_20075 [Rhodohalobacter sp. SW132]
MKNVTILFTLLFAILLTLPTSAQEHDYPAYPPMDFRFQHLEGTLEITEMAEIRGDITYTIRFLGETSDSLVIDAERMQVEDIRVDERTMDFEFSEGKLTIFLDEEYSRNDTATLQIVYSTRPVFGVLNNYRGTIFSSGLPLSTSHWLPVLDHPGVSATTDLRVVHPSSRTMVMTGQQRSNEVVSVEQEETRYASQYPVPLTSLFFAVGPFQSDSRSIDNVRYHIHTERPNGTELEEYRLQNIAAETIEELTEITGIEYPLSDLHILILNDLIGEERPFGAGTVLVDVNHSIDEQIIFGTAGQWAGVMVREMEWKDPEALQLLMGFFAEKLDLNLPATVFDTDLEEQYDALRPGAVHTYRHFLRENPSVKEWIEVSLSSIFDEREYPLTWNDFTRMIYRESGQYLTDKPVFEAPVEEIEQRYLYSVNVEHNEAEGEVLLKFDALGDALDELVTVQVTEFTFNESRQRELTFTGGTDEIVLSVPADIENLLLRIEERDDIDLELDKPFMFWIHQLRNGESPKDRREGAAGLRNYSDNPDLQLALLDIIEDESDADVYAEILRTLSFVTDGASGTSDMFLSRTRSDHPERVQIEAVRALSSYGENDMVISRLQSIIRSSENETMRREAIHSLAAITDLDRFTTITESLIVQESTLYEVPLLLETLSSKGGEERAVQLADTFLSTEFPYELRSRSLQLILDLDQSQQGWENRIDDLITDRDPRIRYLAVGGLQHLSDEKIRELLDVRKTEEFDLRVYRGLEEL